MSASKASFALLQHPYRSLTPVPPDADRLRALGRAPGSALVWQLRGQDDARVLPLARGRPGGLALLMVLPPPERLGDPAHVLRLVEETRPAGILPHHESTRSADLAQILRRPPDDLAVEVTDYLRWRGLVVDRDTVQLLRRTVELSTELRSVAGLSRALYLSRRALGRRFMSRGLPVPSHWLHFARLLRVVLRLQNTDESVLGVGYRFGYPDGFSLSNQMLRLTGFRPSEAREYLGWEWFMEAWLRTEADEGGLSPEWRPAPTRSASAERRVLRRPGPPSGTRMKQAG